MARDDVNKGADREEGGPSLLDLLRFFGSSWKLFLLLALVFSAVSLAVVLLLPQRYEKQVTLSATPVPNDLNLLGRSANSSSVLNTNTLNQGDVGQLTAGYLQGIDIEGVEMDPVYNKDTQRVNVSLASSNRGLLDGVTPRIVETVRTQFRDVYEESLGAALEAGQADLERNVEVNKETLEQVNRQIAEVGDAGVASEARLQALENERAEIDVNVSQAEIQVRNLEQTREDLSDMAMDPVVLEVIQESAVSESNSALSRAVLALVGSLLAAAAITVLLGAFRSR